MKMVNEKREVIEESEEYCRKSVKSKNKKFSKKNGKNRISIEDKVM